MKRLLTAGATLFLLVSFGGPAAAVQVFQWTGPCDEGCTGVAAATLTLDDSYVLGNPLGTGVFPNPYFVAFSYSSTSGTIDVPGDAKFNFMQGSIPAVLPGPSTGVEIDFFDPAHSYFCAPNGPALAVNCPAVGWTFRFEDPDPLAAISITDAHRTDPGTWSRVHVAVPEPGTFALVALGLAGLGAARRRGC